MNGQHRARMRGRALWLSGLLSVLSLALVALAFGRGAEAVQELLANPGFEEVSNNQPTGWTILGGSVSSVDAPVHGGTKAAAIGNATSTLTSLYQVVPVTAGRTYRFSGYLYKDLPGQPTSAKLRIIWKDAADGSGANLGSVDSSALTSSDNAPNYVLLTVEGVAPEGALSARAIIVVENLSSGFSVYADDMSFLDLSEPTATPTPTPSPTPSPTATPPPA